MADLIPAEQRAAIERLMELDRTPLPPDDRLYVIQWLEVFRDNMTLHGSVLQLLNAYDSIAAIANACSWLLPLALRGVEAEQQAIRQASGLTEEQRTLVRDLASGHDYAAPYDASSDRNGRHHKVAAALRAAVALIDRQAAELAELRAERDRLKDFVNQIDKTLFE